MKDAENDSYLQINLAAMLTWKVLFWALLALAVYTYVGYGLVLWVMIRVKRIFKRPASPLLPDPLPEVTLLIAAYNEEAIVQEKMANCEALDYPADKFHIAWATDGSNDSTVERLSAYPRATVFHIPDRKGKTAALNRVLPFIKTALVVFTDANTILNREAIKEIVAQFTDPRVGCVAGEKRIAVAECADSASAGEGFYWKYESKLKEWDSELNTAVGAAGELFAIRTELFEIMPQETLLDDFILSLRIAARGYKIAYCSTAYAVESASADMKEEAKRKVRIAAGGLQSIVRLAPLLNPFRYGLLSFQYVSHRVLRWTVTPFALAALIPLNLAIVWTEPTPLFIALLIGQTLFYLTAWLGYRQSNQKIKNKFLFIPYYFTFMNINVFRAFLYLRRHKRTGAWAKAKRRTE